MEKVKLIYNPVSGLASFKNNLDYIIERFQSQGYQIVPYRTRDSTDAFYEGARVKAGEYAKVLVAGGDGTIHQIINGLHMNDIQMPIGIFPVGTANDLANYLGLPRGVKEACDVILKGQVYDCDLGIVNNKIFVNIASAGLLTDVSQKTDIGLKNNLGKLAYYLKGIEQIPYFHPLEINLRSLECNFSGQVYLFLVMNGRAAGGFPKVAPKAEMQDGLLDVLLFKPCPLPELVSLFIKVVKGEHLNSPHIQYFQTKELIIESNANLVTDLDGEKGPNFPLKFSCLPRKMQIYTK